MKFFDSFKAAKMKKEKEKKVKAAKKLAVAATVGSAFGAVTGLLFAPKSGKETRTIIAKNVKEASETVRDSTDNMKEKAVEIQKGLKGAWGSANKFFTGLKEKKVEKEEVVEKEEIVREEKNAEEE